MTRGTKDDDEPTRWTSIGWQALLITNRLRVQAQLTNIDKEQKIEGGDERKRSEEAEKRALERLEFVNTRLRELDRFEHRAAGKRRK